MGNKDDKMNKKELKKKYIIGEIEIKENDINKKIRIISLFEEYKRENKWGDNIDYQNNNEKEIREKCKIKINDKNISFSFFYKFKEKGKFIIKYIFSDNITKN